MPPEAWQDVLRVLAGRPYAGALLVYGSAARGAARAGSDLDVILPREATSDEAQDLRRLTMRHYPALDAVILLGGVWHARDRWGEAWEPCQQDIPDRARGALALLELAAQMN